MADFTWDRNAGGWVRTDRGGRPVGPWRSRRLDRGVRRGLVPGRGDGPSGPGDPMAGGDRVPRVPNGPLPSLAAELEVPTSR